jgi:cell division protein FtsB
MREFERKKKVKKILYSRTSIFILLVITVFLAHATFGVYQKAALTRENVLQIEKEKYDLDSRHQTLEKAVAYLQTDEGIETEIRRKFRAIKPGEQVAVIINTEVKKESMPAPNHSFWMKIKDFFDIL